MGTVNPHASMVFHDPSTKNHNDYKVMGSQQEKTKTLLHYLNEWKGQQLNVVNILSGEVRTWEMSLNGQGRPTRHARVNCMHLLFGNWRIATPEDVLRQTTKDKITADIIARTEANRAATKAGFMFSELQKASKAILDFQTLTEKEKVATEVVEEKKPKGK